MDKLLGFLSKTLNLDNERLSDILYKKADDGTLTTEIRDEAEGELLNLDADRVKKLKGDGTDAKTLRDEGYKRGQKEALEKVEKKIKSTYGITDDKPWEELVSELATRGEKSMLEDDKVKIHPLYRKLEKEKQETIDKVTAELTAKYETLEKGFNRRSMLETIKAKAAAEFDAMRPLLPKNAAAAAKQREDFLAKFEAYDYKDEGDSTLIMDGEKRLEDKHGNPITLKALVKNLASERFDFEEVTPKGSPGNENGGGKTKPVGVPKSKEEYNERYLALQTAQERKELKEAWEQSQASSA